MLRYVRASVHDDDPEQHRHGDQHADSNTDRDADADADSHANPLRHWNTVRWRSNKAMRTDGTRPRRLVLVRLCVVYAHTHGDTRRHDHGDAHTDTDTNTYPVSDRNSPCLPIRQLRNLRRKSVFGLPLRYPDAHAHSDLQRVQPIHAR